ncbi:hypothetical protein BH20ACT2_BH20ACT2_08360 [soil metagenome]
MTAPDDAVVTVFRSRLVPDAGGEYQEMADRMEALARTGYAPSPGRSAGRADHRPPSAVEAGAEDRDA